MTLEEYSRAKKRARKLKKRLDRSDPSEAKEDLRVARKLLSRILKKIEEYEKANNIDSNSEYDSDSSTNFTYREPDFMGDNRTEEQLMDDLGIIYAIFGRIYKKSFNYHEYIIHFQKLRERGESFCQVYADIYEDAMLIANNIVIEFWPFHNGDTICGDMGISSYSERSFIKYMRNGSSLLYQYLISDLKDIWNYYFGLVPLRIEAKADHEMQKALTATERDEVIARVDRQLSEVGRTLCIPQYLRENMGFYTRDFYLDLKTFLEKSGIIYEVREDGVYIFYDDDKTKSYMKLIGIKKSDYGYNLELSTI